MEENQLRALLRAPTIPRRRGWRCLSETALAAFADGGLEGKAQNKAEAHLAACSHCREQVSDLVRLADWETAPDVPPGLLAQARGLATKEPRVPSARVWQWSAAASALAVLVLVVTVELYKPGPPPTPQVPAAAHVEGSPRTRTNAPETDRPEPDKSRSAAVNHAMPKLLAPREGATKASEQLEFHWTPVQGSVFYEVEVLTADGSIVWAGRAQATHLELPKQASLKEGKYFVWVRAHLADGKTRKSEAVSFQIAGER